MKAEAALPAGNAGRGVRSQGPALVLTVASAALITALVPLAVLVSGGEVTAAELLRDPAALTGAPWYLGALTWATVMVWAAGAALYLVSGRGLGRRLDPLGPPMTWLGAITVAVAADDAFLFHEVVLPSALRVPEMVVSGAYGVAVLAVLTRYRAVLLRQPETSLLILALTALAGSVAIDLLGGTSTGARLAEDGLKLLGALAWAVLPAKTILRSIAEGLPAEDAKTGAEVAPRPPMPQRAPT